MSASPKVRSLTVGPSLRRDGFLALLRGLAGAVSGPVLPLVG